MSLWLRAGSKPLLARFARGFAWLLAAIALSSCADGNEGTPPAGWNAPPGRLGVTLPSRIPAAQVDPSLAFARQAGARWLRFIFPMEQVQPSAGTFRWGWPDTLMAAAMRAGLQPLPVMTTMPAWNSNVPDSVRAAPPRCPTDWMGKFPPLSMDAWVSLVGHVVERYKGRVHAWEIWNEPDLDGVTEVGGACTFIRWCGTPHEYAQLLDATAAEIRRRDPQALVVLGGLAYVDGGRFLRAILADSEYPAARSFDVMNLHFYGSPARALDVLTQVHSLLDSAGVGDRPIWVSETGYASEGMGHGAEAQREYLLQVLPSLLVGGAEKVFWHRLTDQRPSKAPCAGPVPGYGLIANDMTPKPAYFALQSLARQWLVTQPPTLWADQ